MPDETSDPKAVAAGWDPDDGDPPFEHGEFVDGLASADNLEQVEDAPEAHQ